MTDPLVALATAILGPKAAQRAAIRRGLFARQLALYDDPSRRKAVHSGRRAGKSTGLPAFALMDALDCGPSEVVILGGETKDKAEALYRSQLAALIAKHALPFTYNGRMRAFLSNSNDGSGIYLWGIADRGAADMLRGFKVRAATFDEAATVAQHLRYLAEDAIGPALGDLDGTLMYAGTPSLTRAGDWFDICAGKLRGWSVHHWDVRDNPMFPRAPEAVLAEEAERYGGWDVASFQREWLGLFVDDPEMQVYAWADARNGCDMPAHFAKDTWAVSMGVDFGMADDCAWVVGGNDCRTRVEYELHAEKHKGMLPDDACEVTARLCREWGVSVLVGDAGGLGKPYVEQWNARRSTDDRYRDLPPMLAADKTEKRANIQVLNDELRSGRVLTVRAGCRGLIDERLSLPWKDAARLVEDPRYANHLCDAGLYRFRSSFAYMNEVPKPKAKAPEVDSDAADEADERRFLRRGDSWWDR